ncbi:MULTISPECIES: hypothetical protein [Amycolatopsis]|uniref:Uncharacterized protein n=1 Tax=Amycolatopsis albidoflavus TaxID=102226 RepID=A0ABW5I889_9PSEU
MSAITERWVKTLRAELLDCTLIWSQTHLRHALLLRHLPGAPRVVALHVGGVHTPQLAGGVDLIPVDHPEVSPPTRPARRREFGRVSQCVARVSPPQTVGGERYRDTGWP